MNATDGQMLILGIGAVVGIIMLFAQVKLFSIASSLKDISNAQVKLPAIHSTLEEILKELRKKDRV